jgi:hypothetical protein
MFELWVSGVLFVIGLKFGGRIMLQKMIVPTGLAQKFRSLSPSTFQRMNVFQPDRGPPMTRAASTPVPTFVGELVLNAAEHGFVQSCMKEKGILVFTNSRSEEKNCAISDRTSLRQSTFHGGSTANSTYLYFFDLVELPSQ